MAVDIPQSIKDAIRKAESGGQPYIKATTSSASGLYQFLKATWIGLGGKWGGDPSKAFGGLKPTVAEQNAMFDKFIQQNAEYLTGKGVAINSGTLYAAHFLGNSGAVKVYKAPDTGAIKDYVSKAQMDANPNVFKNIKTVADFKAWALRKGGGIANAIPSTFQSSSR